MKTKLSFGGLLLPLILLIFSSSCKKEVGDVVPDQTVLSSGATVATSAAEGRMMESDLLKSLRQATSRFHSTTQAIQAGYVPDAHCVSSPAGGMGYHWANLSLLDNVFDPMKPEVVMYEVGPGGNLRLTAVEYLVLNTGQTRPTFDGHPLDIGGAPFITVPHWTLHVWVHKPNPSGLYAKFNPTVSCP